MIKLSMLVLLIIGVANFTHAQSEALSRKILNDIRSLEDTTFEFELLMDGFEVTYIKETLNSFKKYPKLEMYFVDFNDQSFSIKSLEFSSELIAFCRKTQGLNKPKIKISVSPPIVISSKRVCYLGSFRYKKGGSEFVLIYEKTKNSDWLLIEEDTYLEF